MAYLEEVSELKLFSSTSPHGFHQVQSPLHQTPPHNNFHYKEKEKSRILQTNINPLHFYPNHRQLAPRKPKTRAFPRQNHLKSEATKNPVIILC